MIDRGMQNLLVGYGNRVFERPDGRMVVESHLIVDAETWGQMVSGYRCKRCLHWPQSEPFPEQCEAEDHRVVPELGVIDWRCPMRMRDDQLRELANETLGEGDFEPQDPHERIDVERDDWKPRSGIRLPGHAP